MKFLYLILFIFSSSLYATPKVLLSYFDTFGSASFNNSERVAKALKEKGLSVKLCKLNTIFDKAFHQLEDCMKEMKEAPLMVLGLGEAFCGLKVENVYTNIDKTIGADNEGNHRNNTIIIPGAPKYVGSRYPLPKMYCSLSKNERKELNISNNAGSFVCNNTAFQMAYRYPEIQFGFIHVPAHNCRGLRRKTTFAVNALEKMINEAITYLEGTGERRIPHSSNDLRLPITRNELSYQRNYFESRNECLYEYFNRLEAKAD